MTQEEEKLLDETIENMDKEDQLDKVDIGRTDKVRFSTADWFEKAHSLSVGIYGVGGIGSWVACNIARLCVDHMYIVDLDIVNEVNMAGQLYGYSDIGLPKVKAVVDMIGYFAQYNSVEYRKEYLNVTTFRLECATICGFDNMAARSLAFDLWTNSVRRLPEKCRGSYIFIDARLAAEELQIYCILGDDSVAWNNYRENGLFKDSEAEETPCTYKQTSYCGAMVGALITSYVANFAARLSGADSMERAIPYFTYYNCGTAILKQRMYAEEL